MGYKASEPRLIFPVFPVSDTWRGKGGKPFGLSRILGECKPPRDGARLRGGDGEGKAMLTTRCLISL
jgi:hypothetical protein